MRKTILLKRSRNQKGFVASSIIIAIVVVLVVTLFFMLRKQGGFPLFWGAWQDYSSNSLGFSVSLPSGWSVEEKNAQSGSDIIILDKSGAAFVRIRGFLDPNLDSADKVSSSIDEYKKMLALQRDVVISNFQTGKTKEEAAGFSVSGQFTINGTNYRFEERGQISSEGQALIMRAADVPEDFDSSLPAMKKIMDSFKLQ